MSFSSKAIQGCSCTLAIACSLGCFSCGDCVEAPSIASITPSSTTAGSPELALVVNGNHFQRDSIVNWNGTARATIFVNGHQLQTTITAEDLAAPAAVEITVFSPPQSQPVTFETNATSSATSSVKVDCAGGSSNVLNFAVNP
ncbi:MAG: IPT/TIG domain-containing protein [Candidatus Sulfotelmatobacter sp.]